MQRWRATERGWWRVAGSCAHGGSRPDRERDRNMRVGRRRGLKRAGSRPNLTLPGSVARPRMGWHPALGHPGRDQKAPQAGRTADDCPRGLVAPGCGVGLRLDGGTDRDQIATPGDRMAGRRGGRGQSLTRGRSGVSQAADWTRAGTSCQRGCCRRWCGCAAPRARPIQTLPSRCGSGAGGNPWTVSAASRRPDRQSSAPPAV